MSGDKNTEAGQQAKPGSWKPGKPRFPQGLQKPGFNQFGPVKGGFKRDFTGFRRGSR